MSRLASLILALLTLFTALTFASTETIKLVRDTDLEVRQDTAAAAAPTNPNDPRCAPYEATARLAIVGGNSTYRTAFMQLSRTGTNANRVMLNAAVAALPPLLKDAELNAVCGNFSASVANQTEVDFFQGNTVLGLGGVETLDSPPGKIVGSDMSLLLIISAMLVVMCGTWSLL